MNNLLQIKEYLDKKFGSKFVTVENDSIIIDMGLLNNMAYTARIKTSYIIYIYDDIDVYYYDDIKEIISNLDYSIIHNESNIPTIVLTEFIESKTDSAGFIPNVFLDEENDMANDTFFELMRQKATIDRKLIIYTFGKKYTQFDSWKNKSQVSFSVLHLNSSRPKGVSLNNVRGTDATLQKCVRNASEFDEIFNHIIVTIEARNLSIIGVYCKAGHHRSVAIGELLKIHVYKNAKVTHLTINK